MEEPEEERAPRPAFPMVGKPIDRIEIRVGDLGDIMGTWDPELRVVWIHESFCEDPNRNGDQEKYVERTAALLLIDHEHFYDALQRCHDDEQLATELNVDAPMLHAFIDGLNPAEADRMRRTQRP
jgi:hypothetical protein